MSDFLIFIEYIGIIAFAISGALEAIKHKYDFLGVVVLGITTATAGGVIRDIILGVNPPYSLRSGINIYLALFVSIIVFVFNLLNKNVNRKTINRIFDEALVFTDALGLSVFTISGIQIAYTVSRSYSLVLYVFVGVISGVGGGLLRDIFTNEIPYIFERHVYASASIIGAISFHLLSHFTNINSKILIVICASLIFIIRILAYHYNWNLPKATKVIQ